MYLGPLRGGRGSGKLKESGPSLSGAILRRAHFMFGWFPGSMTSETRTGRSACRRAMQEAQLGRRNGLFLFMGVERFH